MHSKLIERERKSVQGDNTRCSYINLPQCLSISTLIAWTLIRMKGIRKALQRNSLKDLVWAHETVHVTKSQTTMRLSSGQCSGMTPLRSVCAHSHAGWCTCWWNTLAVGINFKVSVEPIESQPLNVRFQRKVLFDDGG